MSRVVCRLTVSALILVAALAPGARAAPAFVPQNKAGASDGQIKADVERRLAGLDVGSTRLTVTVQDGVVTLSGNVPSLWAKEEAVNRARKASGIQSLVADLTIARAENDAALAREVGERVRKYDLYTVYDSIEGRVNNGVVSLSGGVTEPKKASDIVERVAKVRGVQAINNKIEVLPASQSDNRLRTLIVNAIYRDPAFENYSMADPPIHVIVNNGHVTLIGVVRSQIERIKAESAARAIFGVLALDNKVQLSGKP